MSTHSDLSGLELHEPYHFVQETDPGAVGSNKYWLQVSTGTVKRRNIANSAWQAVSAGTTTFTGLSDVPSSYVGQAGKSLKVNAGATALEFFTPTTDPSTTKGDLLARNNSALTRLAVGTDGQVLTADAAEATGIKWAASGGGGSVPAWVTLSPDTPPASPNAMDDEFASAATLPGGGTPLWTWMNQGSASIAIAPPGKGVVITVLTPGAVINDVKGIEQTTPATPWEFTTKVALNAKTDTNYFTAGILLRESSTNKLICFSVGYDVSDKIQVIRWNSPTSFNVEAFGNIWAQKSGYLRVRDNGTNIICSASIDGLAYFPFFTESRTAFLAGGANRVGVYGNNANATFDSYNCFQWFRRTL